MCSASDDRTGRREKERHAPHLARPRLASDDLRWAVYTAGIGQLMHRLPRARESASSICGCHEDLFRSGFHVDEHWYGYRDSLPCPPRARL